MCVPLQVEETDPKVAVANSFTIYGGNRCLMVAASSLEEKDKWMEDLQNAIVAAKESGQEKNPYPSLKSNSKCNPYPSLKSNSKFNFYPSLSPVLS